MQIPTEDQLMNQFLASRNTVRGALRELTTRGLVYTLHGKGTFVSEPVAPIVITLTSDPKTGRWRVGEGPCLYRRGSRQRPGTRYERLRGRSQKARPAVARSLGSPGGHRSHLPAAERLRGRTAVVTADLVLPQSWRDRAPRLLDTSDMRQGTIGYLAQVGINQVGYQDTIEWRTPDEEDTAYFDLIPTATCRWSRSGASRSTRTAALIRLTVTTYRADGTGSSSTTATFRAT